MNDETHFCSCGKTFEECLCTDFYKGDWEFPKEEPFPRFDNTHLDLLLLSYPCPLMAYELFTDKDKE